MTRRSIINLSAVAIIAAGAFTLLDARPASAATYSEGCDKLFKIMRIQAESCALSGGTYYAYSSCDDAGYSLLPTCVLN